MATLRISKSAQKQASIVPAAYYPSRCIGVDHKLSADQSSMNHFLRFKVVNGEFTGVKVTLLINEKALDGDNPIPEAVQKATELVRACGITVDGNSDIEADWDVFKDAYVDVHIAPGPHYKTGETENQVKGFKPFSGTKE